MQLLPRVRCRLFSTATINLICLVDLTILGVLSDVSYTSALFPGLQIAQNCVSLMWRFKRRTQTLSEDPSGVQSNSHECGSSGQVVECNRRVVPTILAVARVRRPTRSFFKTKFVILRIALTSPPVTAIPRAYVSMSVAVILVSGVIR